MESIKMLTEQASMNKLRWIKGLTNKGTLFTSIKVMWLYVFCFFNNFTKYPNSSSTNTLLSKPKFIVSHAVSETNEQEKVC